MSPYSVFMSTKPVTKRGQSKAPSDLAVFIDAANWDQKLPDPKALFSDKENAFRTSQFTKLLSAEMLAFLGDPNEAREFRDRYDALRSAQEVLPSLADERTEYEPSGFTSMPFSAGINFYTHDGVIGASGIFVNALRGVRKDRIRRCAVCEETFWARRINSECCTEKCRKTYNQRNSRIARAKVASKKGG